MNTPTPCHAARTSDSPSVDPYDAIRQAALDYIEGYYEGDVARMERAVHPKLAKRVVRLEHPSGRSLLEELSAQEMVQRSLVRARKTGGKTGEQRDVTLLDVYGNAASAKIVASGWIDYLHLAKFEGRWVVINVLWEIKY